MFDSPFEEKERKRIYGGRPSESLEEHFSAEDVAAAALKHLGNGNVHVEQRVYGGLTLTDTFARLCALIKAAGFDKAASGEELLNDLRSSSDNRAGMILNIIRNLAG